MNEKVAHDVKKRRTSILIEQGERKKRAFFEENLGRETPVLFEQQNKEGRWSGYTSNYIHVMMESNKDLHNKLVKLNLESLTTRQQRDGKMYIVGKEVL
jgi:threonylcarbamoyladenosine tRNA methylthiotransferase MtaB